MKRFHFPFYFDQGRVTVHVILCRRSRWRIEPESRQAEWGWIDVGNLVLAVSATLAPAGKARDTLDFIAEIPVDRHIA